MKSRFLHKQWILKGTVMGLLERFNLQLSNKDPKLEDNIMIKKILTLFPYCPIQTLTALKI